MAQSAPARPAGGRLLLGPGHLGEPNDLSLRVVEALRTAALLVVEAGSEHGLAHVQARLSLPVRPVAFIPTGPLPAEASARILATLDEGGTVLLFGVDEGIPGYADPGAAVVRAVRETRPDVPVRSLGGTSVIGAALLASGLELDRVTFLGVTTAPPEQRERKLREALGWIERLSIREHAVALLSTGADVVELAERLARMRWLRCELVVCASLTRPEERTTTGAPEAVLQSPPPAEAPCVVFVSARLLGWHPRAWWTLTTALR